MDAYQSLAQARGLLTKYAVKQVDRLLSNQGIDVWELFGHWVPQVVGARQDIVVAMDWTDFDADGHATLALNLITRQYRAAPHPFAVSPGLHALRVNPEHAGDTLAAADGKILSAYA
ncbi:MAG: hypothetical protein HQL40_10890 [Alphaproteobacteria bacterium]|nr:hypothetical protein [Alphaproteobacteria bacterium]